MKAVPSSSSPTFPPYRGRTMVLGILFVHNGNQNSSFPPKVKKDPFRSTITAASPTITFIEVLVDISLPLHSPWKYVGSAFVFLASITSFSWPCHGFGYLVCPRATLASGTKTRDLESSSSPSTRRYSKISMLMVLKC